MSALPLKVSRNEQLSVICFRWAKGHSANASKSEMRPVYGNECFTRPAIHVFGVKFAHGHESVVDEKEPGRRVFFRRPMQRSQQSIPSYGLTDGINV